MPAQARWWYFRPRRSRHQLLSDSDRALIGGIVTALLVYLLAFKRGVQGFRLIIVGIAISAVLAAVNTWLILKADLEDAMSAAVWGREHSTTKSGARAAGADRRGDPGDSCLLGRLPDANARHGRRRGRPPSVSGSNGRGWR